MKILGAPNDQEVDSLCDSNAVKVEYIEKLKKMKQEIDMNT